MKWKDLSIKDKKQLYDSIRINNPKASYFDIRRMYDEVPAYEDGGKKVLPNGKELPPEYTAGTPEYYQRQAKISGRAEPVQPESYLTPAGYVKDAISFVENVSEGNYKGAALDAALNVIPWGVGKGLKRFAKGFSKTSGATREVKSPGTKNYESILTLADHETIGAKDDMSYIPTVEGFSKIHTDRVKNLYQRDLNRVMWDVYGPDNYALKQTKRIDKEFGTNYAGTYQKLFKLDESQATPYYGYVPVGKGNSINMFDVYDFNNSGKHGYVRHSPRGETLLNRAIEDGVAPTFDEHSFKMAFNSGLPYDKDVAIHELGHVVDATENNGLINFDKYVTEGVEEHLTNPYLNYLADPGNRKSLDEIKKEGTYINKQAYDYFSDPSEVKSHMLAIRRRLLDDKVIQTLMQPISKEMIDNNIMKLGNPNFYGFYKMYKDPNRFVERMNKLIPASVVPAVVGSKVVNEDKKTGTK